MPAVYWIVIRVLLWNANAGEWDGTGVSAAVKPWFFLVEHPQQFMRQQVKVSNNFAIFFKSGGLFVDNEISKAKKQLI